MPVTSQCPSCKRTVRVPDNLLGRMVRCPSCKATFTVGEEPDEEPEELEVAPRPRRRPVEDEYEEEPEEEEYEERPRPRRRKRRSRERAKSRVMAPAIALMAAGGLGLAIQLLYLILVLAGKAEFPWEEGGKEPDPGMEVGFYIGLGVSILWGIIVVAGGISMLNLSSYGTAMTGTIFAMLPCNCLCLLGLPFGIWSLAVLNDPDVNNAFG